jgi:hypothetical protein
MHQTETRNPPRWRAAALAIAFAVFALIGNVGTVAAQTIRGTIVDSLTRKPVVGASVVITARPDSVVAVVFTDSSGNFSARLRRAGEYGVLARRMGYLPRTLAFEQLAAGRERVISLAMVQSAVGLEPVRTTTSRAPMIRGRVVEASSDNPLMGAIIHVLSNDAIVAAALSARDGTFQIAAPRPGAYIVAARSLGYSPIAAPRQFVDSGETRTLQFAMEKGLVLMDTVRAMAERGFFKLTPGRVYYLRHAAEGKGVFFEGLEVALTGADFCSYLGAIPGVKFTLPMPRLVSGIKCGSGRHSGKVITSDNGWTCLSARVDRYGTVSMIDSTHVWVTYPAGGGMPIWIGDVRGVELYRGI